MAVGPTESLSSGILAIPPQQLRIAQQISTTMAQLVEGMGSARISPSNAIPPSNQSPGVRDDAIGSQIDLSS